MKKLCIITLVAMMTLAFAGCGANNGSAEAPASEGNQSAAQETAGTGAYTREDTLALYNGQELYYGCPFSIFLDDGWVPEEGYTEEDQELDLMNPKYPGFRLYFCGNEPGPLKDAKVETINLYSIQNEGKYETIPPLDCKGLTFGASKEEFVEKYGEPDYIDDSNAEEEKYVEYHYYNHDFVEGMTLEMWADFGTGDDDLHGFNDFCFWAYE